MAAAHLKLNLSLSSKTLVTLFMGSTDGSTQKDKQLLRKFDYQIIFKLLK